MTANDTAGTTHRQNRDINRAPGGASCRIGYPNGLSNAEVLAPGGADGCAGLRTRAPEDQHSLGHQGVPFRGEASAEPDLDDEADVQPAPAFPDRAPHRRAYQPRHREDVIATRLSADEKAEIIAAAKRAEMYPSGYLAAAGLAAARGTTTVHRNAQLDAAIDELAALRAQISRVGNNVNQIAYIYNAAGRPRPGELTHALTALKRTLARVDDAADALVKKRT
jgi:hypothetical protein